MKASNWPLTFPVTWAPACLPRLPTVANSRSSSASPTSRPFSASRSAWLSRGSELFADPMEHRVSGMEGWFGAVGQRPPRWKQAVAIWLAFFPVSLLFNFGLEPLLAELGLFSRVLVSTLALTPLMVYLFIPLSTHLLAGWLNPAPPRVKPAEATV